MVNLKVCKVSHDPYKEEFITEVPERIFEIDGYQVAERLLEGIIFLIHFDENGEILKIDLNERMKKYFENNFNSKRFYKEVENYAKDILSEGDEVNIPSYLEKKYYKNGINVAYIEVE